ncbi:MAG TPA: DNA-binding protein [Gammaproteobacteria bacterium]
MSLKNLLKIGQLIEHYARNTDLRQLLDAAHRAIKDAANEQISTETRFDAAYRAIMQTATAALWANGYRPSTSVPGHHRTTLQSLSLTLGTESARVAVLDRLRHKRNLADYTGEDIDDASLAACIHEARCLIDDVEAWMVRNAQMKN